MPGLDDTIKHETMTPLTEAFHKRVVRRTDDLTKKASIVCVGDQFFQNNALNQDTLPTMTDWIYFAVSPLTK
jgi:hypothetical protein